MLGPRGLACAQVDNCAALPAFSLAIYISPRFTSVMAQSPRGSNAATIHLRRSSRAFRTVPVRCCAGSQATTRCDLGQASKKHSQDITGTAAILSPSTHSTAQSKGPPKELARTGP